MVLGDDLALKGASAVGWNLNGLGTKVAFEGLLGAPIAGVAGIVGDQLVFVVAQVLGQFGLQCSLNQGLGQLLQEAVLTNQDFGLFVPHQKGVNQLVGEGFHFYVHQCSRLVGSFLPNYRLHKTSDTLFHGD